MIQEKNFPLRGRRPRSGNVFENHFLNRDNLGKMQLKTRKNVSSCIELEQYTKQSVFLYFPYISYGKRKMGKKVILEPFFFLVNRKNGTIAIVPFFRLTRKKNGSRMTFFPIFLFP